MTEDEWRFNPGMRGQIATRYEALLTLAAEQDGVAGRRQLIEAGLSAKAVDRLVADGLLVALHPGVYAVGHTRLRPRAFFLAAVLACGPGAVLSDRSAAAHHGLLADARARIDVTVPPDRGRGRTLPGITLHRRRLSEADLAWEDGVRVTSIARTLIDVAASASPRFADRAVSQALVLRLYDQWAVDEVLRRPGRLRGAAVLRAVLERRHPDAHMARSELESRAIERLMAAGIPPPRINVWLPDANAEVDLLWEDAGLAVELDGRAYHAHRGHLDRARDARVEVLGVRVRRFGWGDVTAGPFPEMIRGELRER